MLRVDDWKRVMVFALKMTRCNLIGTPSVSSVTKKVQTHSCSVMVDLHCVSWMRACDTFNAIRIGTPVNSAESKVRYRFSSSVVIGLTPCAVGFNAHTLVLLHSLMIKELYLHNCKKIRFELKRVYPRVAVLHRNVQLGEHSPGMIDFLFRR